MVQRKKFTSEFKREAVRLMESSSKPAADVARELGVRRNQLYRGRRLGSDITFDSAEETLILICERR